MAFIEFNPDFVVMWWIISGVLSFFCAIFCGIAAACKNRSVVGWIFLGLFFGLISLIIILCLPSEGVDSKEKEKFPVKKLSHSLKIRSLNVVLEKGYAVEIYKVFQKSCVCLTSINGKRIKFTCPKEYIDFDENLENSTFQ